MADRGQEKRLGLVGGVGVLQRVAQTRFVAPLTGHGVVEDQEHADDGEDGDQPVERAHEGRRARLRPPGAGAVRGQHLFARLNRVEQRADLRDDRFPRRFIRQRGRPGGGRVHSFQMRRHEPFECVEVGALAMVAAREPPQRRHLLPVRRGSRPIAVEASGVRARLRTPDRVASLAERNPDATNGDGHFLRERRLLDALGQALRRSVTYRPARQRGEQDDHTDHVPRQPERRKADASLQQSLAAGGVGGIVRGGHAA